MGGLTFTMDGSLKVFARREGTPSLHHKWYTLDALGELHITTHEQTTLKPKTFLVKFTWH